MTVPLPDISIVICTHNPDIAVLGEALRAISNQQGNPALETVLVDNCSSPHSAGEIERLLACSAVRRVAEPKLGLSQARRTGIGAARAPLICFVDDDNILSGNYIETALRIAKAEPRLGVFGGRSLARPGRKPGWLCRHFLSRYAVRDSGSPVTLAAPQRAMRGLEPFGAGMVARREVAEAFSGLVQSFEAGLPLGRVGNLLGSGEDSLFTRAAFRMGLEAGYRPELTLEHVIPADRLRWPYLKRLIEGQARSEAILDYLDDQWPDVPGLDRPTGAVEGTIRFLRRLASAGAAEAIGMTAWDRGYRAGRMEAAELAASISETLLRSVITRSPAQT